MADIPTNNNNKTQTFHKDGKFKLLLSILVSFIGLVKCLGLISTGCIEIECNIIAISKTAQTKGVSNVRKKLFFHNITLLNQLIYLFNNQIYKCIKL